MSLDNELAEVADFLAGCPPFDRLEPVALQLATRALTIRYLRRGAEFPPAGENCLWLVRQGAIELRTREGELARRLGEGDSHDAPCLPDSPERLWVGHAAEDSLLYALPEPALRDLWGRYPELHAAALADLGARLRRTRTTSQRPERDLTCLLLAQLIGRAPICAAPETTVRAAATLMTQERVSALLIVDAGALTGIVTDRDLRSRCLAAGLSDSTPLAAIMTPRPVTLTPEAPAFEALVAMTRRGIHHLPVVRDGQPVGLVSSTDLLRAQSVSSIYLADRIHRAADLGELVRQSAELPELWRALAQRGDAPLAIGRVLSGMVDALAARLLALAENRLGPPPVAYCWIAYGSQGRQELTLHSDQDNALILADDYLVERHGDYFAALAQEVCDGLAACGFILCPGLMMASSARWRKSLDAWRQEFDDWLGHADVHKARLASNLFDFRPIHGDFELALSLRRHVVAHSPQQRAFLAHLVANDAATPVPLGLFRQFVVARSGAHAGELDLKRDGLLPLVDVARVIALAAGVGEVSTVGRLQAAAGTPWLSTESASALVAAFEFLLALRVRHQVVQLQQGLPPDNFLAPASLSADERQHLRAAFQAIDVQQQSLAQAFPEAMQA